MYHSLQARIPRSVPDPQSYTDVLTKTQTGLTTKDCYCIELDSFFPEGFSSGQGKVLVRGNACGVWTIFGSRFGV